MQALILAGGLGTRLRPVIGDQLPKSMAVFAGRPFLEYLVLQLRRAGFRDLWFLVGHGAEAIQTYFGTGDAWGARIGYSMEPMPLGTGGALRYALPQLDGGRFLVLNGDSFLDAPIRTLTAAHREARDVQRVDATLALVHRDDASRFGGVDLARDGTVSHFREKHPTPVRGLVSAGIAVVERTLIEAIPDGRPVSLEREVWPARLDGRLRGVVLAGAFEDMGVPDAHAILQADPAPLLALGGVDAAVSAGAVGRA